MSSNVKYPQLLFLLVKVLYSPCVFRNVFSFERRANSIKNGKGIRSLERGRVRKGLSVSLIKGLWPSWQGGSVGKARATKAWWHAFDLRSPQKSDRKGTTFQGCLSVCLLVSIHTCHMHTEAHTHTHLHP